jgi:thiamine pyrophosphate-dependent acetolactate synthase large subunit-like protein
VYRAIALFDALQVLHAARGDAVVVTSMGTAREWAVHFESHPLDFIHVPSAMGHTPGWGLGLALAQPRRRVIVCCGDGSLQMNLGCLVTIAAARPRNLTLLVFDNGAYEVTGGQPTPAATVGAGGVDFTALARAAGFENLHTVPALDAWRAGANAILYGAGPVFAVLPITADPAAGPVGPLPPPTQRAATFAAALRAFPEGERRT